MKSSYPEGNIGGNQLLDGSISLSPLYPKKPKKTLNDALRTSKRTLNLPAYPGIEN
jgi:hypothetical protein